MDKLPSFALQEVIVYLSPETAYCYFPQVCMRFYKETREEQVFSSYLNALFGLPQDCRCDFKTFARVLSGAFGRSRENMRRLELTGFATNGGIDGNNMIYWVGNMFKKPSLKGYCSEENKNNIVCAAVLSLFLKQETSPQLEAAKSVLAGIIRSSPRLRLIIPELMPVGSQEKMTELEENIAMRMFPNLVEISLSEINGEEAKREKYSELARHYAVLGASALKLQDVLPDPTNRYLLEKPIDKDSIRAQKTFFWTRKVAISRKGGFTCPVETFMVFVSMDFIPLESDLFNRFNNLREESDLRAFVTASEIDIINSVFNQDGCSYHEFRKVSSPLQPILWGKFTSQEGVKLKASLQQCFAGKYFYVKLINPENRMRAMNDFHEFTNIDIQGASAKGFIETLV